MSTKTPCTIIVQKMLPSIKAMLVEKLMETNNTRQSDVSASTKVTPATITQYARCKGGAAFVDEIAKSKETMKGIAELVEALTKDPASDQTIVDKLCQVRRTLESEGLCGLEQSPGSP